SHRIGRTRKPRLSAWQQLNQTRDIPLGWFGNKKFVLALVILVILIGSLAIYATPTNVLFHSHPSAISNDPYNVIWSSVSATGLTPFNTASRGSGSVSVLPRSAARVRCTLSSRH